MEESGPIKGIISGCWPKGPEAAKPGNNGFVKDPILKIVISGCWPKPLDLALKPPPQGSFLQKGRHKILDPWRSQDR